MDTALAMETTSVAVICDIPHWGSSGHSWGYRSMYPNQMGYLRPAHQADSRIGVSSRTRPVWTATGPGTMAASSR